MAQSSLVPLKLKNKLAPTPQNPPRFSTSVQNATGSDEALGDPRATRALVALMNQHAVIGGAACHWGGPAAFAEIMSSLHGIMFRDKNQPWYEQYNFVNDAGHTENGIYALRANYQFDGMDLEELKGFRSIESKLTGHGEAHLNPEGVFISNGPLGSGVPQAQGLAMADKLIGNNRVTLCTLSDGGSMEGETKEAFAAIPGLAKKGKLNPFVLLISDNNTKLSGRIDSDSFDMNPTFASLETLGWDLSIEIEGNNLQKVHLAIENAIEKASRNPETPVCVVFKTVKGFGVKSTEESASGGHGYPLKAYDEKLIPFIQEIYSGEAPDEFTKWAKDLIHSKPETAQASENGVKKEKVQPGFARATIRAAKEGLPVFSITADLQGSTGIKAFHQEFPDNYIDVGVAESNMVSAAVGLSKQGFIPIVDTFAQFGVTKGNLPLIMANLSGGPIIGLFSHTGFQDAADGASHQATTYFSATSSIPHTTIVSCGCSSEAEAYMYHTLKNFAESREKGETPDSVLFFFGRENHPEYYSENPHYEWGKAQTLREGTDLTIVATGPTTPKALAAAEKLAEFNIKATIINNAFINKPDVETIGQALQKTNNKLITIEDHQEIGGMGALLSHALLNHGHQFQLRTLATPGKFGQSAYKADHLYNQYGLGIDALVTAAKELCS